jgi:ABC-type transporter Mla subunit MlaD
MPLQDLTPQLRTRLSRMEKAVGWFVLLAIILLAAGFAYYVYQLAERKGWFVVKAPYYTYVDSAAGLHVGDPVMLMGFPAGSITDIQPMPANQFSYNVFVKFVLKGPNIGYMWTVGSVAKITTADLLGKRQIEITKGTAGYPTYIFNPLQTVSIAVARTLPNRSDWLLAQEINAQSGTNLLAKPKEPLTAVDLDQAEQAGYSEIEIMDQRITQKLMTGIWNPDSGRYDDYDKIKRTPHFNGYGLSAVEAPAVTEQLQQIASQVQHALPGVFALTNELARVLSHSATLTSNLNLTVLQAHPLVTNLAAATAHLNQPGALGEWLLPTNLNQKLQGTLGSANTLLASSRTNLTDLVQKLGLSLDNLAGITSNLNAQVQANSNMLASISQTVVHADQFLQGLKRFWLFRSLFRHRHQAGQPPTPPPKPLLSPKAKEERSR